jgi:ubiquinone/menaquinone biosynthesis C-methylase UbiE
MLLRLAAAISAMSFSLVAQNDALTQKFFADVTAALALREGSIIADVGAGDNPRNALGMAKVIGATGRVVCVDVSQQALEKLKAQLPQGTTNIEVQLGNRDDPLLPPATFDAVLISNAYHEMTEYRAVLARIRRALKRNGRVALVESVHPARRGAERNEQVKHHELSPEHMERELTEAGFTVLNRTQIDTRADKVRPIHSLCGTGEQAVRAMSGLYSRYVLPRLIELAMKNPEMSRLRAAWIPQATGAVLEAGIGSGFNLPFYSAEVQHVYGVDPSMELQRLALRRMASVSVAVDLLCQSAEEELPFQSGTIDSAVVTWTLCSISNAAGALAEIRRVLKPSGRLIFVEHGRAPETAVAAWQDRLTPVWKRIAGGCHLNRKIDELIIGAGFQIPELKTSYLSGPKPMTYTYQGIALPASGRVR